jgi:FkbM family methyltransferase
MYTWNNQIDSRRYESQSYFKGTINTFYSQYSQDRSLETCIFKGYKNGIFMDIGAHDGVDLNNTLYFELTNNWTGINVEPISSVYDRLKTNRPNNININCAVTNTDGISEFIYNTGYTEMLSGLKSELDFRHINRINDEIKQMGGTSESITVETRRVESICDQYNINQINYLSIDVEGGEMKVLESINYNKVFIDVIGFENNYKDIESEPINFLINKGYIKLPDHVADIFMVHHNSKFNPFK